MSSDNAPRELGPAVQLFQKAHQKIAMLARLDEQLGQLLSRRRSLQVELRSVQAEINEEFDRLIEVAGDPDAAQRESVDSLGQRRNGAVAAERFTDEPAETGA